MSILKPSGPHLCQHLNVIYLHDSMLMGGTPDWPGPDFVYDPSSGGSPSDWPPILYNPDGSPSDVPPYGRYAGGPDGSPPKRRRGGTGYPHPPDVLTRVEGNAGPHKCFVGQIRWRITKPPPDFFGYTGQVPSLFGALCAPYAPPGIPGPTTGFVMRTIIDNPLGLSPGLVPVGTLLPDAFALHLWLNVGHDSYGEVIEDFYDGGNFDCIPGLAKIGDPTCGGTITPSSKPGGSIGVIVHAAPLA